ncbi:hypothetical protein TTHERM_00550970 (macronuclear) [Tetrahymena thermophila SB210]|uniref:Kinase domain protein n=1 Tax=Tetrahymena thermophila (strain SB210) TaxID=312017 RepID=Q22UM9_TETTS|nr:hypothetical protein TTHERM_00550970 [Tetrahymena thermophila SB210]EAR88941.2 hypothetical protein TTHERM_00550970 [Tetrahymena thermophila SB210]|eukprot:XP_001009186.2 hypothetical protein TTHERM_00550970 [Tetrahymena thermophila SB210]
MQKTKIDQISPLEKWLKEKLQEIKKKTPNELEIDLSIFNIPNALQIIADSLDNWNQLYTLNISLPKNEVTTSEVENLVKSLQKYCCVSNLSLVFNCFQLNEDIMLSIGQAICSSQNIQSFNLALRNKQLDSQKITKFLEGMEVCTNLTQFTLNLSCNQFDQEGALKLADIFTLMPNLIQFKLLLTGCQIGSEGVSQLGKKIAECHNLQSFSLGLINNNINYDGASKFLNVLSKLSRLNSLNLNLTANKNLRYDCLMNIIYKLQRIVKFTSTNRQPYFLD